MRSQKRAVATLHSCEEYIQAISNRPYEYDLKSKKINQDYQKFEKQLKKYKYKSPRNKSGMMLEGVLPQAQELRCLT